MIKYFNIWRISAFFCALMLSFNGLATTYYVANGGSDSDPGTIAEPWADISVSVGKLAAGDTLLLKRGSTFNETDIITIDKTSIKIDAYDSGVLPIISGGDWDEPAGMYAPQLRFGIVEKDNSAASSSIKNVHLYQSAGFALNIYSNNITVDGITITRPLLSGITAFNFADGTIVRNSSIYSDNYGYGNQSLFPDITFSSGGWGAAISIKGSNSLVENNFITSGWGESVAANCGANGFTFRNNNLEAVRLGLYADSAQNGLIERNRVVQLNVSEPSGSGGIAFNVEPNCRGKALNAGLSGYTQNIVARNNLIAGWYKAGIYLADEWGRLNNAFSPMSGIYVYHNTVIDGNKMINITGGNWTGSWIKNNIFHMPTSPTAAAMINGASTASVMPVIANNYFTTAPSSGGATGSITSGIDLVKETGWRTATTGLITDNDFEAEGSSTTFNAGIASASLGNSQSYTLDYYGNAVSGTPNIGAFEGGDISSSTLITAINGGSNIIAANQSNTAIGTLLSGVYSGTVSDGVDSEALSNVLGYSTATSAVFDTGALTGIGNPITLTLTYDTPDLYDITPRSWSNGGITTISNYTVAGWIFDAGARIAANSAVGNAAYGPNISATSGQVVNAEIYLIPGTSGKYRVSAKASDGGYVTYRCQTAFGSCDATAANTSTGGTSISTLSELATNKDGVYKISFSFTTDVTGTYRFEVGPETSTVGQDVVLLGVRAWVARSGNDATITVNTVAPASIDNLNTDDVIDPINAANGANLFALSGSIGAVTFPVITPNASGSVATFKSPDISALAVGTHTLTLNVAQPVDIDQTPTAWTTNSANVTVTPYVGTHLGYGGGATLTVGAGGADWAGFKVDSVFSVAAGDNIEQWFDVVQGVGGQVRASITNETAGGYLDYKGIIGALASSGSTACSASSVSETVSDGMVRLKLICTSLASGTYRVALTTNSAVEGDSVHVLGRATFVNAVPVAKTLTVTKAGDVVVWPEPTKKFVWSTAAGNAISCYNAVNNTFAPYTGNMAVTITSGDFFTPGDNETELAYAPVVAFVDGQAEMVESNLTTGSINALSTGDQGYNYWATNGTCRADNAIELTAE